MLCLYWRATLVDLDTWEPIREVNGRTEGTNWAQCAGAATGGVWALIGAEYSQVELRRLALDMLFALHPLDSGTIAEAARVHQVLSVEPLEDDYLDLLQEQMVRPDDPRCE